MPIKNKIININKDINGDLRKTGKLTEKLSLMKSQYYSNREENAKLEMRYRKNEFHKVLFYV